MLAGECPKLRQPQMKRLSSWRAREAISRQLSQIFASCMHRAGFSRLASLATSFSWWLTGSQDLSQPASAGFSVRLQPLRDWMSSLAASRLKPAQEELGFWPANHQLKLVADRNKPAKAGYNLSLAASPTAF